MFECPKLLICAHALTVGDREEALRQRSTQFKCLIGKVNKVDSIWACHVILTLSSRFNWAFIIEKIKTSNLAAATQLSDRQSVRVDEDRKLSKIFYFAYD